MLDNYTEFRNDPLKLFSTITNLDDKEKGKQFLIEINHKDNIDVCEYSIKAIENGFNALQINLLFYY